ncbi:hypothetical protein BTO28_05025 [Domibacillus epiphyticus]|uniref:Phosphodiester glycosidase domain-containing protein n=2 Tax=Domibacillus epiphyticus TaxID=1714355 RepID=A0A1V2AA40_9BACI|nr:hypothetical protein BTO28_05025 [Domibacillus epiphyticus]
MVIRKNRLGKRAALIGLLIGLFGGFETERLEENPFLLTSIAKAAEVKQASSVLVTERNEKKRKSDEPSETSKKSYQPTFKKYSMFNSAVYVYTSGTNETLKVSLGTSKLERLINMKMNKETAKINMGMFGPGSQHGGMYLVDGKYIQAPSARYISLHLYKDGRIDIANYDNKTFARSKLNQLKQQTNFVVGTSYALVQDGVKNLENAYRFSHSTQRNPRSLFGQLKDGRYILVAVDGRSGTSKGVTADQSALIMLKLGAVEAVNFDGGGSSSLVVRGKTVNRPTENRNIGSALFVVKK